MKVINVVTIIAVVILSIAALSAKLWGPTFIEQIDNTEFQPTKVVSSNTSYELYAFQTAILNRSIQATDSLVLQGETFYIDTGRFTIKYKNSNYVNSLIPVNGKVKLICKENRVIEMIQL